MADRYKSFVVFAEMRTGSNLLAENLSALEGVTCLGEAFNPAFLGAPGAESLLGVTQKTRDRDPLFLLEQIRQAKGLFGFRYFHDHDPRIYPTVIEDENCAKIILTRDPVESYVSWKIARRTGQWKLTDAKERKTAKIDFDREEFFEYLRPREAFQSALTRDLQLSGQTGFHLTYEDLASLGVINGLAAYLGVAARLERLPARLKVQNPGPVSAKVNNPEAMESALSMRHSPDLHHAPNFEPRRRAIVPAYVAGARTPLIYMPIRGALEDPVKRWMAKLDRVDPQDLPTQMSQKTLRQWKRARPGHRSFTVVQHPFLRAYHAYCTQVSATLCQTLVNSFGLRCPADVSDPSYGPDEHRAGFFAFLHFLRANLSGQTAMRVDPAWCSQSQAIKGFSAVAAPDMILREVELPHALPALAKQMAGRDVTFSEISAADAGRTPASVYNDEVESLVADVYRRDYLIFGFDRWG